MTKYMGDWRIAEVKGHMVRPEGQQGRGVGGGCSEINCPRMKEQHRLVQWATCQNNDIVRDRTNKKGSMFSCMKKADVELPFLFLTRKKLNL